MQNLKQLRQAKGWSQTALSAATGIARPTMSEYECLKRNPALKQVELICKALGCTATELVGF